MERKKLSDILSGGTAGLQKAWDSTEAAADFSALPAGVYVARVIGGELTEARSGTPGYKLTFRVLEGEHAGRPIWHDLWLTPAAVPMTKRDLAKLGITRLEQLEQPLPAGIRCKLKVALRKDDNGDERNRVQHFEVTGIDSADDPDFAPAAGSTTPGAAAEGELL
ncbi:MAG: DUF669 domain-containing protein [Candidatus Hydrogenedentes bacterium]|nr:DUF669 domain-containing protein [Candidatus Hydrogenedentota bacterium]